MKKIFALVILVGTLLVLSTSAFAIDPPGGGPHPEPKVIVITEKK
jgi:hypothetical protein